MKYKLICFDLDGTIVDEVFYIWQTLHEKIGTSVERRKELMAMYYAKKITYRQWAEIEVEEWKKLGADKQQLMSIINPLRLMPGAMKTIKELKDKGYKLAIISGSLNIVLDHVMPNYRDYFDHVFINELEFDMKGKIIGLKATDYDIEHKATGLQLICDKEKISAKDAVFIGDNENDVHIAEMAGMSIAFNCKSDRLAQISEVVIKEKDLSLILNHLS